MYEKLDYEPEIIAYGTQSYLRPTMAIPYGWYQQKYAQQQAYPSEPVYDFRVPTRTMFIKKGQFKLMPKGFDYLTGTITKELKVKNPTVKEVKSKKIMPRLFRYCMYIGLTYVVLDIAFNFNTIINFIVHTFILHK